MNEYIKMYKKLHKDNDNYGIGGVEFIKEISLIIDYLKPKSVLDYGCGKGGLIRALSSIYPNISFYGYDPAIDEYNIMPVSHVDLVLNTDVLEHIPENDIPKTIEKIRDLAPCAYFNLHHAKASAVLSNGENAHCTVRPPEWYHNLFLKFFPMITPLVSQFDYCSTVLTFAIPDFLKQRYLSVIMDKKIDYYLKDKQC